MVQTSLLSGSVWLALSPETRAKIAELYNIKKSGNVYVVNGPTGSEVQSDGYTYNDLSVITVESMQEITGSKSDNFYHLFKNIVAIVEEDELLEEFDTLDTLIEITEEAILDNLEKEMEESTTYEVDGVKTTKEGLESALKEVKEKKKFCEHCDSKARFHKKGCITKNHETKTA